MLVCVWEEGGGWQVDFMFASYIEKGRKGGGGGVQNPELSCVRTLPKTPHANICKYES